MAFIFDCNDKHLAYGMKWGQVAPGRGEASRIADLGNRFNATHKLRMVVDTKPHFGFLEAGGRLPAKMKKGSLLSAAALFASMVPARQNSILVYIFENKKKAAIIALVGGVVYQDILISLGNNLEKTDGVIREDGTLGVVEDAAIAKIRDRIDSIYNETGQEFVPYGNFYIVFPESGAMAPEDLLRGNVALASLTKFSDPRNTLKIGVFSLILAGSFVGYNQYKEAERKRKELEAAQMQVDPMQLYRNNLASILPTLKFTGPMARTALLVPMMSREMEIGGWLMSASGCSQNGMCAEIWALAGGNNTSFVEKNKVGQAVFNPDLKSLVNSYVLTPTPAPLALADLPKFDAFWKSFTTQAQELSYASVAMTANANPDIGFSLPPGVAAGSVIAGQGIARAEFNVTGPMGYAGEVLEALPSNAMVGEINLVTSDRVDENNFSIKGFYYVQK